MRLSYVSPFSRSEHRRNLADYARLAEDAGYEGVWIPEAFGSDAFTLLGALAAQTRRLRLATGIVNVFSRTPALLAQSFATLDEQSDGRAVIGLGTSGPVVVEHWHGLPFDRPARRLREAVEILRLALTGERVDYDGEIFKLRGFRLLIRPVQPRMPIYLATLKPKAVRLTGEIADGWLPTHVSLRHVEALRAPLREGATAARRDPDGIDMAAFTLVACCDNGETARGLCREHLAYYVGGMGTFYHELLHGYAYGDIADRVQALWKAGDRAGAADAIPREVLDDLVIAGTPQECLAALTARERAGFQHVVAFPPHGIDPDQLRQTLRAVALVAG
jgi:F420-dependent oxidoreductase-like protein